MSRWGFVASIFSIVSAFCVLVFFASSMAPLLVQKLSDLDAKQLARKSALALRTEFDLPGELSPQHLDPIEYLVDQFVMETRGADTDQEDPWNPLIVDQADHFGTVSGYAVFTRFEQLTIAGGQPLMRDMSYAPFAEQVRAAMRDGRTRIFELPQYEKLEARAPVAVLIPLERLGMSRGLVSIEIKRHPVGHLVVRGVQFSSHLTSLVLVVLALFVLAVLSYWGRQRRIAERQAIHLADYDSLTGLPNRRKFQRDVEAALQQARWEDRNFNLISLDVDAFKQVNDYYGHEAGDRLLVVAAKRLSNTLGQLGQVYRLSGDEFVAICWADGTPTPDDMVTQFLQVMQRPITTDHARFTATMSVGSAQCPKDSKTRDGLIKCADLALYDAKANGAGQFVAFRPELQTALDERFLLQTELELALEGNGLEVAFQPLVRSTNRCVMGFEALARWPHKRLGAVSPGVFIPLAESTGLIEVLTDQMLYQACRAALHWPDHMIVAVNISPVLLRNENFVDNIAHILERTGLPAHRLEIEITEGVFVYNTEQVVEHLTALRALGVQVAMDDFGTGYSSLNYLTRLPISKLKIDKSFVARLGQDKANDAVVSCVVGLAKTLGIATTAEGVENETQATLLRAAGCDFFQGYLFGHPTQDPAHMIFSSHKSMARFDKGSTGEWQNSHVA
ncbi:putative bifunctional diguanylate cyclase/phosphodiesterase [Maritalea mediterranea]|uniref:Bifunctional diguanylate cyclase/phosphodiesterase n=1 Tax=Maritalea mediterranea TaxID=2909667 RepID=A0ABS9E9L4_9HYPH|nr:bifunctional diguanylate cyclase/phosphodiesterase [Maritalea mediterranea]MCF4099548.1 bifunctional diguanylate cyclase/phosphodiesterase [Maritalea mediterranea]